MNPRQLLGKPGNNLDTMTVRLVVLPTGASLTPQQLGWVENAFGRHMVTLRGSLGGYLAAETELPDGSRLRIVSNSGQHTVTVWPVGGKAPVIIPRIFSGIIRDSGIVDAPPIVLRDFQPTEQCWQYPLGKSTSVPTGQFSDIKQLAVGPLGGSAVGDSKFTYSQASMYSGLMAKVVQVILGYGREDSRMGLVTNVVYNWKWDNCHGAASGPDGTVWLLWVSSLHGLLATPLPLMKNTSALNGHEDVVRETVQLLGGLPSGKAFPPDLDAAIADGTVLQLLTTTDLSAYFSKLPFSPDVGWSFNADGSEAHNVVYADTGFAYPPTNSSDNGRYREQYKSSHFKLSITIGALTPDRTPGQPLAECSASLTLVEEVEMRQRYFFGWMQQCAVPFYTSETDKLTRAPTVPTDIVEAIFTGSFPVLACHIDGVLEVLRVTNSTTGIDATSDHFPTVTRSSSDSPQFAVWPRGMRDGYIMVMPITDNGDGTATDFILNVVTPRGDVITAQRPGIGGFGGDPDQMFARAEGPLFVTNGLTSEDGIAAPVVNLSMFGATLHAVYSSDFSRLDLEEIVHAKATGSMLGAPLVPKPQDPDTGQYPWTTYAFAGYME